MLYNFTISTPASTTEANALKTVLPLCQSKIYRVSITFPTGPAGLLYFRLKRALHQLIPFNTNEWVNGDGIIISSNEHLDLYSAPYQLEVYTYNSDDTYAHNIIVSIDLLPLPLIQKAEELRQFIEYTEYLPYR